MAELGFLYNKFLYNRSLRYDYLTCLQIQYDDINISLFFYFLYLLFQSLHLEISLIHLYSAFSLKVKYDIAMPGFI